MQHKWYILIHVMLVAQWPKFQEQGKLIKGMKGSTGYLRILAKYTFIFLSFSAASC